MVMTRHSRSQAAIALAPVDRPPRYVPAMACQVASELLGRKAHAGTGSLHFAEAEAWCRGDAAHEEFQEQLYEDLSELYRALDIDVFRMPWRMSARPARRVDEYTFLYGDSDGAHTVYRYCPETCDFAAISSTAEPPDEGTFARRVQAQERALEEGALEALELGQEHLEMQRRYGREFFLVYNGGSIGVGLSAERMMLLALAPDVMAREMMVQARRTVALARMLHKSPCPGVMIGGLDLAGAAGPLYSPETFRRVTLPAYRYVMDHLRPMGVHFVFRSDGNLWPLSDMLFVEAGVNGFGEVDREAGMTAGELRRRYPKLVLWGNFSSSLLARATWQQVRDEARRIVEESGAGGYYHGCSNAILPGTPARNVEALFSV
jgi:hypothetical protein